MMEAEITQILLNNGVAVATLFYVLIIQRKTIEKNTEAVDKLNITLEKYYFEKK